MKKHLITVLITIAFIIFLSACGSDPTIDATNDVTMKSSIEKVMEKLSNKDKEKFQKSLTAIYMSGAFASMGKKSSDQIKKEIGEKVDGKTAKEIIAMAEEMMKKK